MGSLSIKMPIRRIEKSKIQVVFYSSFVKVSVPERGVLQVVDLWEETVFESGKWTYEDSVLTLVLKKKVARFWDAVEVTGLSKPELKARRETAVKERTDWEQRRQAAVRQATDTVSRQAVEERYQQEKNLQGKIDERLRIDKETAIDSIFTPHDLVRQAPDTATVDHELFAKDNGRIMSESELTALGSKPDKPDAPARQRTANSVVQLPFSKRVFPNLAVREQHFEEPMHPQSSKRQNTTDGANYMWFKERGDNFVRNKDYSAAKNAYQEALKLNENSVETRVNYATSKLILLDFIGALELINSALDCMKQKGLDREFSKVLASAMKKKALLLSALGDLEGAKGVLTELIRLYQESDGSQEVTLLTEDMAKIELRMKIQSSKFTADELTQSGDFNAAFEQYTTLLQEDPDNEKLLSNMALVQQKLGRYTDCIATLDHAITIVTSVIASSATGHEDTNIANPMLNFLLKLYLRKAECQESLNDLTSAESTIKTARKIDEHNEALISKQKAIKRTQNKFIATQLKAEYKDHIQNQNYQQALEATIKSDSLLDTQTDFIDVIRNSANKVVCYLKLERPDSVLAECLRCLKMITNVKQNFMSKLYSDNREIIDEIEVKMRIRNAYAMTVLGQKYNAKQELQKALETRPDDPETRRLLSELKLTV